MPDNSGWDPNDNGAPSTSSPPPPGDTSQMAQDVYSQLSAQAGLTVLPLVLLGLPSHTGTQVNLIVAPGAGTVAKSYYGKSIDATFPGDDLYIELHADMEWHLPLTAATQTSDNSVIKFTDPGHKHTVTITSNSHTHDISVTANSHQHTVSGTTASADAVNVLTVTLQAHTHDMFDDQGVAGFGFGTAHAYQEIEPTHKRFVAGFVDTGTFRTGAVGGAVTFTGSASGSAHNHPVSGQTTSAITSINAFITGAIGNVNVFDTNAGSNVLVGLTASPHQHIISPTTASIRATMALVIDGTIIVSGLINGNLFQAGGFTGTDGIIHMANIFILKKDSTTVNLLRGGHHKVGLYFSITVVDWGSGVASFNNPSFSIRNAGNDARVKIYTP